MRIAEFCRGSLVCGLTLFVLLVFGCTREGGEETSNRQMVHPSNPTDAALEPAEMPDHSRYAAAVDSSDALPHESGPLPDGIVAPAGMVFVPGGQTTIGSNDGFPSEQPMFTADVEPFFMDQHEVTVAQFREFVEATGFATQAEKFGNSAIIDERTKEWILLDGANWRMPTGPSGEPSVDDHPVTHVSWNDAVAYAGWAGKRLPTEIEWEHAARGAVNSRSRYPPGLALDSEGFPSANLWQGVFPYENTGRDGSFRTAAIGSFGANTLGLVDMAGNVWEWVDSWYRPYSERNDPFVPDEFSARVQRGGSFLCNDSWCHGFRVSARGQSTPESSHYHVGFRCVMDIPEAGPVNK